MSYEPLAVSLDTALDTLFLALGGDDTSSGYRTFSSQIENSVYVGRIAPDGSGHNEIHGYNSRV